METVSFDRHGTRCDAWHLTARTEDLSGPGGRPVVVVMAHGFGATRDSGLLPFAERFADAGCDVVVFDYRGFGTSAGHPRQDVDHRRHREDYHAALTSSAPCPASIRRGSCCGGPRTRAGTSSPWPRRTDTWRP